MKISFEKKFLIIFLLIALCVFAFSEITYRNNKTLANSNFWVTHTHEVLYRTGKVLSDLKDVETGVRGYIITGDTSFLAPYYQSKDSIVTEIEKLSTLTRDNAIQQMRIDTLHNLAIKRLQQCAATTSTIKFYEAIDRNELLTIVKEGKAVMDKIRLLITAIEAEERRLLVLREKANDKNYESLKTRFYLSFGSLFIVFALAYFIMRYIFSILKKDNKSLFQLNTRLGFLSEQVDDIFKGISDPFFALDKNWNFIYLNTAAQKKMGYDKGPLIGRNIFEVFAGYKETVTGQNMLNVQQTGVPVSFEAYNDFFERWQELAIYPTANGVTVYIKDATERKATETDLLRTKRFLEETNEVAIVGGWELDIGKGAIYWTSVTRLIHETEPGFTPDLKSGINFYKAGKDRDTITMLVNRAIAEGRSWDAELQIVTAKGRERWVRAKGKAEFDDDGNCVRLFGSFQDIDDQKKLDFKLKQSETQFRSAFEYSAIGMALIGPDGKWNEVNESLCNIVGYSREELVKLTFQEITHPEDLETDLSLLQELMEEKRQSYHLEKRYYHKDGGIVWVLLSVSMVKGQYGKIIHFISQIQDITQKKLSEKALQNERKLLRTIIDHLPLNVYLKDLASKKILVNKSEVEYAGAKSEADILGKNDYDLYPDKSAMVSIAEDQEVFKTGKAIIDKETLGIKKDGTETWFLTSKIPFLNNENVITGLLGISYDITVRNQIKKALETSEQKLSTLFDLSPVGFALSEFASGKFLEFNNAFANKLGYTGEEIKKLDRLKIKPSEYWDKETEIIQSLNEQHSNFGPIESAHIRKDGSTYPILLNGLKIIDPQGRAFIWTVVQDITNLKEKEKELKRLNLSVEANSKALAVKNEELEQFAYVASHDLQEPLRMITGFLSKIEIKYNDLLDDNGRTYIKFAVNGAVRMRQLITDILDYSRLVNSPETNFTAIDLNKLVSKIILPQFIGKEGMDPDITVGELPVINAARSPVERLFSNLISNAIKYQPPGNKPIIKINAEDKGTYWEFSIADNGIGIDPLYFHKVFNVFQRLHNKTQYSGTGIGLAICKKIVNNLKGEIWITSMPEKGATFYFTVMK